ncbi:MAG: GntR family transcriptional regulator [Anaerolineaceae bacterium]|nr:GntR family transcriptional regulator [Anaerolineaceae bacterium]
MEKIFDAGSRSDQVKIYLRNYIQENALSDGDQLPSEASIAKTLGVSRNTLREAYIDLESEGVIVRRHGIGTFVAHPGRISDSLNTFAPFSKMIRDSGFEPYFKTLSIGVAVPPTEVVNLFHIPVDKSIHFIQRLVSAGNQPVIYIEDYFSPEIETKSLDWDQFDGDLVKFLSSKLDLKLNYFESKIRATALHADIAPYLQLDTNTPVLSVCSTIYTDDNRPIVCSKINFNSNIIEMNIVRVIRSS